MKNFSCNHQPALESICSRHRLDKYIDYCVLNTATNNVKKLSIESFMVYSFVCGKPVIVPNYYHIYAYSQEYDTVHGKFRVIFYRKKLDCKNSDKKDHIIYNRSNESGYLQVMKKILQLGEDKPDRTGTGTKSIFSEQMRFDLSNGTLPLLTTKRVAWKTCLKELLWFLRGETDVKILQAQNVHIWDGNSSREFLDNRGLHHLEEGDVGPNYSWQWRHFGAEYKNCHEDSAGKGIDQIERVINLLKHNPYSRRIVLTSWNPTDVPNTALPSCHIMVVFNVSKNSRDENGPLQLNCHMFQRSQDFFHGAPFNIASYAFLTHIIALKVGMEAKELVISTCDTHIYNTHIDAAKEQLDRSQRAFPVVSINDKVKVLDWDEITVDDFEVISYSPHPAIKRPMAV
jgi:thymidylate synthase